MLEVWLESLQSDVIVLIVSLAEVMMVIAGIDIISSLSSKLPKEESDK
jgi:hypothetical protein